LLYAAIISNTLNFQAAATTVRDKAAAQQLALLADLPADWPARYFLELDDATSADILAAVSGDTKVMSWPRQNLEVTMSQLEVWDARHMLQDNQETIASTLEGFGARYWLVSAPSLSQGYTYLLTPHPIVQKYLQQAIGAQFKGPLGVTKQLWLRKEIIRELARVS
jgi:hypothetical protein